MKACVTWEPSIPDTTMGLSFLLIAALELAVEIALFDRNIR
jgi:hypothetical protein